VIRTVTLVGLAGLALAPALFLWQGVGPVLAAFAAAGLGILWSSLFHAVSMALNARAWQLLLPLRRRGSVAFYFWAVWLREAVNGLLPVARIGGEVISAQLLIRHGLRPVTAVASLVVDMTVSLLSQFTFTLLGLAVLVAHGAGGGAVGRRRASSATPAPAATAITGAPQSRTVIASKGGVSRMKLP